MHVYICMYLCLLYIYIYAFEVESRVWPHMEGERGGSGSGEWRGGICCIYYLPSIDRVYT